MCPLKTPKHPPQTNQGRKDQHPQEFTYMWTSLPKIILLYMNWTELPSWLWTKTTISKVHTIYWKGRQVIKQHIIIYFNLIYEYFLADLSVLARAWVFPFLFFFFFFNFPRRASDRWQKAWTLFKHEAIDSE